MYDDTFPRYYTCMARLAQNDCELFTRDNNHDDFSRVEFFVSFPISGICQYPFRQDIGEFTGLNKRLKRLIHGRADLAETATVVLALLKAMNPYPMSAPKRAEYKEFVRREDIKATNLQAREARLHRQ
ncbi:hypothetical protein AC1031_012337 [Aphanomyces cochlioides]|nr:hypothetical protein AC1031_012337 [Aphanomyces cochlioides]